MVRHPFLRIVSAYKASGEYKLHVQAVSFVINYWHNIHDIDAYVKSVDAYLLYPHRSTQESEVPVTISGGFTSKATGKLITILLPDL